MLMLVTCVVDNKEYPDGYICICNYIQPIGTTMSIFRRQYFFVSVITLIITLFISALFASKITYPIIRINTSAKELPHGKFEAKIGERDYAEIKQLAGTLKSASKEIAKSENLQRELMANISHDLRTPLASLRAYAEALDMGLVNSEEERAEYERAIIRKCDEASSLVEDLLQHALSDMDRLSVTCGPVQAAPIVRRCARDSSGLAQLSCLRVDDAHVEADEARLAQAIDNLIGNAIKYARGSAIDIQATAENGLYTIAVRDFGPGIPPEDLPFATERFYRGANASDKPGSGLGLYISSYLAERMGGRLHLVNAHPGLKATIELPLLP